MPTTPISSRQARSDIRRHSATTPSEERIAEAAAREANGDVPLDADYAQRFWNGEYTPPAIPATAFTPKDGSR